ncbi:MAG: hypothetical protein MI673_09385 [Thiotrichales bacterium]|nr:hypothetical protein [Thiotrichales bacterium]
MSNEPDNVNAGLSVLLQLEGMARSAESLKALEFLIVNDTRKLVPYGNAFLFSVSGNNKYRIETASSIAVIDKDAPSVRWLQRLLSGLSGTHPLESMQQLDAKSCPEQQHDDWHEYALPFVLWCPLKLANG